MLSAHAGDDTGDIRKTGHSVNDEIQVYNAEIAKVGQWTLQQHLNYAIKGRTDPDFEGGIIPNRALNGTPELAYGLTDGGRSASTRRLRSISQSSSCRTRASSVPSSSRPMQPSESFSTARLRVQLRHAALLGDEVEPGDQADHRLAQNNVEFIINPIVDVGSGVNGDVTFAPAARLARNFGENFALGIEYYTGLGPLQNILSFNDQQHNIYAVTDFKIGRWDVNAGVGYGLTQASDRWMVKMIIGTELNEGTPEKSSSGPKLMRRSAGAMGSLPAKRGEHKRGHAAVRTSRMVRLPSDTAHDRRHSGTAA